MGISGLLPALKSIQVTRHLEEYSGKTLAVDAYGWLHKGLYSCATELATGKASHKYVDYAMHRVRLLKHYGIQPYIVFDGGPLPAKKGTENERKQKRDENLAKGKALTAQGKHTQARECYIKSVDVTPQMAFQFIKALKAESVPYVVAPYEADSQMAYLERCGTADAILTEDSDLLVFGCKNVLYKLDVVANTVVSISRDQFGSVMASANDPSSISLYGWSDTQFRAMAILSGCDYLPSIPGIGLKTANNLLRKWKTAEQVVKAVALEGKKNVPNGYWKDFLKAEKCFLHQRVYCPTQQRIVNLTEISGDWNDDWDAYVGSDIELALAKSIAEGDSCPITLQPMVDINPGFVPRGLKKPMPAVAVSPKKSSKLKGKTRDTAPAGGILNFFGPNPIIPPRTKVVPLATVSAPFISNLSGKASGKRTLAEVMDQDIERKKKRRRSPSPLKDIQPKQSKFFGSVDAKSRSVQRRHSEGGIGLSTSRDVTPAAGPSKLRHGQNKENVRVSLNSGVEDDEWVCTSEPELDASDLSIRGQADVSEKTMRMEMEAQYFPEGVEQEDGYISPSPSCSMDACDLSSPIQPQQLNRRGKGEISDSNDDEGMSMALSEDDEGQYDADPISSPISMRKSKHLSARPTSDNQTTPTRRKRKNSPAYMEVLEQQACVLAFPTPTRTKDSESEEVPSPTVYRGPDLRSTLGLGAPTEIDLETTFDDDCGLPSLVRSDSQSGSVSPLSSSPETPLSAHGSRSSQIPVTTTAPIIDVDAPIDYLDEEDEEEQRRALEAASRRKAVKDGWRAKWALASKMASKHTTPAQPKQGKSQKARMDMKTLSPRRPRSSLGGTTSLGKTNPGVTAKAPTIQADRAANLRRSDTNVTPLGRHVLKSFYQPPKSAPSRVGGGNSIESPAACTIPRTRLIFFEDVNMAKSNLNSRVHQADTRRFVDLTTGDAVS